MKRLYWLSLIFIFSLSACGGTLAEPLLEEEASTEAIPSENGEAAIDLMTYTDADAGFSIALPANWTTVEPSAAAFAQIGDDDNPGSALATLSDEYVQALLASGLKLYALNADEASLNSEVPLSIQVIRRDAPSSLSLGELVTETAVQLESILDLTSSLEQASVTLGGQEAIQLRYVMRAQAPAGGTVEVHNTQYYLMNDGDLFIITVEMAQMLVDDYLAEAETAVETFTLVDG